MKVLVTGFTPFNQETVNPSYEAVKALPENIGGAEIVKLEIPTAFSLAGPTLQTAVETHRPDIVICVGQAGGYAGIAVERVAVNLRDASIPDNEGAQPVDEPVVSGGPTAYFSTLPTKEIVQALRQNHIPAFLSYTAGTYVCNNLLYTLLDLTHRTCPDVMGGFIHVPYSLEQAVDKPRGTPSMDILQTKKGLEIAVNVSIQARLSALKS